MYRGLVCENLLFWALRTALSAGVHFAREAGRRAMVSANDLIAKVDGSERAWH